MLIGYRCKVCGAPVDPETGYCKYCDTMNFKPIIHKPIKDDGKPRLIIRDEGNEAEILPTQLSLTLEDTPLIEITALGDDGRRFIPAIQHNQYARFSAHTYLTAKAIGILTQPVFDVVFTGFRVGYAHEFKGYAQNIKSEFSVNSIVDTHFDIVSVNPVDMWNTRRIHNLILEEMRCPICGADLDPEKSKCDYCGYWWLYSPEGVKMLICDDLMDVDPERYKWEKPEDHIQKENRTWRYSTLLNVNELKKWDGENGNNQMSF